MRHLLVASGFAALGMLSPYLVPGLSRFRPWQEGDGVPIARLFKQFGELPAFAGHGGSYRDSTETDKGRERLAAEVGDTVAANLSTGRDSLSTPGSAAETLEIEPAAYAGISTFIEDPTGRGMRPFYEALERTATGERGAITRVAHYGDSSIATDLITSTVRERLQGRFGDAGHGFVLAAKSYLPYKHRGVRHSSNDGWRIREVVRRQDKRGFYGYGGVASVGGRGAQAKVSTAKGGPVGTKASRFEIYYEERPRGGTFSVELDDDDKALVSTAADSFGSGVYTVQAPDGPHSVRLRYAEGGPVHLYGVVLERDGPGVVYDSLGLVGARANRLMNFDEAHIAEQIERRSTDLLILGFGGNEASDDKSEQAFYEDYLSVLQHLRQGREDLACLAFAPLDQASRELGRIKTLSSIPKIVSAQRRAAFDAGCAFYNTWEAMGGEDSMRRWYKARPRLAMGDFRHATPAGYEVIGNMFYKALLAGFASYLEDRSERSAVSSSTIPSSRAGSKTSARR